MLKISARHKKAEHVPAVLSVVLSVLFTVTAVHAETTLLGAATQGNVVSEFKHDVEQGVQEVKNDADAQNNQEEIDNEDDEKAGDNHGDVNEINGENNQNEIDNEVEQENEKEGSDQHNNGEGSSHEGAETGTASTNNGE